MIILARVNHLAKILEGCFSTRGWTTYYHLSKIHHLWPKIVGTRLAEMTLPLSLRGKTLIVGVSHPAWMNQLQFMQPALLQNIASLLPDIAVKEIRFKLYDEAQIAENSSSPGPLPKGEA